MNLCSHGMRGGTMANGSAFEASTVACLRR